MRQLALTGEAHQGPWKKHEDERHRANRMFRAEALRCTVATQAENRSAVLAAKRHVNPPGTYRAAYHPNSVSDQIRLTPLVK